MSQNALLGRHRYDVSECVTRKSQVDVSECVTRTSKIDVSECITRTSQVDVSECVTRNVTGRCLRMRYKDVTGTMSQNALLGRHRYACLRMRY